MKTPKFKIGQIVEVVTHGRGCGKDCVGKMVKIVEIGTYLGVIGYKVHPPIGNTLTGDYGGFIGEESFEFVDKEIQKTIR